MMDIDRDWIERMRFPGERSIKPRCRNCRHFETSIYIGNNEFIDGFFCVHFADAYSRDQKLNCLKNYCENFAERKFSVSAYIREVSNFVLRAYWLDDWDNPELEAGGMSYDA
jgi:hypothetical protein